MNPNLKNPSPPEAVRWLQEIAQAVSLREGVEGVARALWTVYASKIPSTREWSRQLHIPVPVLAALRRELEKRDILTPGEGLRLSPAGAKRLEEWFGRHEPVSQTCPACQGRGRILPPEAYPLLEEFRDFCVRRPAVDVTLDQSHATPETGIRKALYLLENGLLGQSLFFAGDDDFISLACWLARKRFLPDPNQWKPIQVIDIDPRYLDVISELSEGAIQVQVQDVREDWPAEWKDNFHVALTDPAYTENAIAVFSARCHHVLRRGGILLLSMPLPDGSSLAGIESNWLGMGWAIREILPRFNEYEGASIHAHQSCLFICEKVFDLPPEKSLPLRYTPFYTGDIRPPGADYECALCEFIISVGPGREFNTIQALKEAGCPECGYTSFRRRGSEKSAAGEAGNPDGA
ncbi:MAG TPA: bis-aminopropyl spermidine synthase family protein [bacterium]|nr:bis-aminopropyl spermidine synthase family protein [Candidatus Omnitrophota bacterium]HOJ59984.1 bis-aminopropyl spermidine synthase family protein [bacterium]HPO99785.1 bis-aminopropyl spermidine synthase family protein [bacterium]